MFGLPVTARLLLLAVFIDVCIKFLLQTASSIPAMAQLAFGLRPVVIAYLHLVLLGIISLFLILWFFLQKGIKSTTMTRTGTVIFVFGVVLNEFFLMIQGIGSLSGVYMGYMPEALALAGLLMVSGLAVLVIGNGAFIMLTKRSNI